MVGNRGVYVDYFLVAECVSKLLGTYYAYMDLSPKEKEIQR